MMGTDVIIPDRQPEQISRVKSYRVGWSQERQRLAWTSKEGPKVREMADGTERTLPKMPFPMNPCVLSPDGRWVATSGGDNAEPGLVIWNADEPADPLILPGFGTYSYAAFSPDSKLLYVFTDERLCALSVGTWKPVWTNERAGMAKSQHQVALSGDGYLLAAVEPPDVVGLYEAATGRRLARLRYPDVRWVGWIALDHAGARLIATTLPDSVISWDLRQLRRELGEMGLDWDAPAYPPAPPARKMILRFTGTEGKTNGK